MSKVNNCPPALVALARFLARYQADLNDLRDLCMGMTPEECKETLIMKWPVIQGTANQIALKSIGALAYDTKLVTEAIYALRANTGLSGGTPSACQWQIERDQLLEMTRSLDEHPEDYDGPCACQLCRTYGKDEVCHE
jgi:hypothetical protein